MVRGTALKLPGWLDVTCVPGPWGPRWKHQVDVRMVCRVDQTSVDTQRHPSPSKCKFSMLAAIDCMVRFDVRLVG